MSIVVAGLAGVRVVLISECESRSSQDIASYREAAKGTTSVSPAKLYGGIISPNQVQANASSSSSGSASGTASTSASASSSTHKSGAVQKKFVDGIWVVVGAIAGLWLLD